jgi:hypothetical protein
MIENRERTGPGTETVIVADIVLANLPQEGIVGGREPTNTIVIMIENFINGKADEMRPLYIIY